MEMDKSLIEKLQKTTLKTKSGYPKFDGDRNWVILIEKAVKDIDRERKTYYAVDSAIIECSDTAIGPGSKRSWFTYEEDPYFHGHGRIKALLIGIAGFSEEEFDKADADEVLQFADAVFGEEQACANMILGLRTESALSTNNKPYRKYYWFRLPDEKVKAYAVKAREFGILSGPLCDMQSHLDAPKKGNAA